MSGMVARSRRPCQEGLATRRRPASTGSTAPHRPRTVRRKVAHRCPTRRTAARAAPALAARAGHLRRRQRHGAVRDAGGDICRRRRRTASTSTTGACSARLDGPRRRGGAGLRGPAAPSGRARRVRRRPPAASATPGPTRPSRCTGPARSMTAPSVERSRVSLTGRAPVAGDGRSSARRRRTPTSAPSRSGPSASHAGRVPALDRDRRRRPVHGVELAHDAASRSSPAGARDRAGVRAVEATLIVRRARPERLRSGLRVETARRPAVGPRRRPGPTPPSWDAVRGRRRATRGSRPRRARPLDDLRAPRCCATRVDPSDVFAAAGTPWYLTLFGRDSIWAARMMLPFGTDLAAGTLRALARRQGRRHDPGSGRGARARSPTSCAARHTSTRERAWHCRRSTTAPSTRPPCGSPARRGVALGPGRGRGARPCCPTSRAAARLAHGRRHARRRRPAQVPRHLRHRSGQPGLEGLRRLDPVARRTRRRRPHRARRGAGVCRRGPARRRAPPARRSVRGTAPTTPSARAEELRERIARRGSGSTDRRRALPRHRRSTARARRSTGSASNMGHVLGTGVLTRGRGRGSVAATVDRRRAARRVRDAHPRQRQRRLQPDRLPHRLDLDPRHGDRRARAGAGGTSGRGAPRSPRTLVASAEAFDYRWPELYSGLPHDGPPLAVPGLVPSAGLVGGVGRRPGHGGPRPPGRRARPGRSTIEPGGPGAVRAAACRGAAASGTPR